MNVSSFDLRAYLATMGIPIWEAGSNVSRGWIGIQCLYCDDHHNHLGVHLVFKNFSCWLCHAKGSLTDLICDLEHTNYRAALRRIDEHQGFNPVLPEERQTLEDNGQEVLPNDCGPLSKAHRLYLEKNRKFDPDRLVRDWGLCSGPVFGNWKHRIIVPVIVGGRTVTFVGMSHMHKDEVDVRYKAASLEESFIPTSELIYGADYVGPSVLVVEGLTDAWRIGRGAVCTFGMTPGNRRIVHLLSLNAGQYFVMYDGEEQAIKHAHTLAANLKAGGKKAEVLEMHTGYDPDNLTTQEVADLRYELKLDS